MSDSSFGQRLALLFLGLGGFFGGLHFTLSRFELDLQKILHPKGGDQQGVESGVRVVVPVDTDPVVMVGVGTMKSDSATSSTTVTLVFDFFDPRGLSTATIGDANWATDGSWPVTLPHGATPNATMLYEVDGLNWKRTLTVNGVSHVFDSGLKQSIYDVTPPDIHDVVVHGHTVGIVVNHRGYSDTIPVAITQ